MKNLNDKNIDFLVESVLAIQSPEECYNFFEDLFTINELQSISQRLVVAKMLTERHV